MIYFLGEVRIGSSPCTFFINQHAEPTGVSERQFVLVKKQEEKEWSERGKIPRVTNYPCTLVVKTTCIFSSCFWYSKFQWCFTYNFNAFFPLDPSY